MKRGFWLILLLLALVVTPALAQDDVLIMAREQDATGLDPHTQTAFASHRLLELIYEPLVDLDSELNIIPALAESWSFSDDAMTLTLNLRAATFHDGSSVTSADVKATFERILNEETGAAARANYTSIASIDTPDEVTVVFNLAAPDVPMLAALASVNASIVPAAAIASGDIGTSAVGSGPFVLDEWVPEEHTTLSAYADWWGEGPFIDGIEIRIIPDESSILAALRAGEIDFALLNNPLIATLLIGDDQVVLNRVPAIAYHVLQLNASREPMDQLAVRQAMACAIDRQEVLDTASLGEGTVTGPLTIPAYALDASEYFCYEKDLDRARELLAEAGLADGFELTVIAATGDPPTAISEAQNIQAQLSEIGITVEIETMELGVYVDRWLAGDFDAAVALNGGRPDPYTMYARYWTKAGNLQHVANYIDDTLDELMAQGKVTTDSDARFDIFADFQRHLVEVAPWIWLYNGFEYTAHQPYVVDFVPSPTDSLVSFRQVKLER